MMRQLRSEFFRLSRSAFLLLTIVVLLVADIFLSSRVEVNSTNLYDLPELCTMSQFSAYAENTNMSPFAAVKFFQKRGQLTESSAEDLAGVFQDIHPWQFRWVLSSTKAVLVFPLAFMLIFLARDFQSRSFNNALYAGTKRDAVYWAKALFLFLILFILSLIGVCALTGIYAGTVFSRLPAGYVWSRLLLHALVDCALAAPMLLVCCLVRNLVLSAVVALAWDLSLRFLEWLPITGTDLAVWEQGGNAAPVLLWSVGLIAVSVVGSWLAFRRAKLK